MNEHIKSLCDAITNAYQTDTAIQIQGGNSKLFYGNAINANPISTSKLNGIIEYEPSELYITAYSGTPLALIEKTLDENNQMLSFEPPQFSSDTTIGGTIACGLSGPRRPYADSIRDCILGTNIINGKGEYLSFGGKVMKNVAGYDVSRLMCGAFGTLGVITQASIKVLPKPKHESTLLFELEENQAIEKIHQWLNLLIPITASYFENNHLWIRLSGIETTINKVQKQIGGESIESTHTFWQSIKNHQSNFFTSETPLWRCIIPTNTTKIPLQGETCVEWNGGLRWIKSNEPAEKVFNTCHSLRGHAALFRSSVKLTDCLSPINDQAKKLHINLKHAFDPKHILNPGRMYSWC